MSSQELVVQGRVEELLIDSGPKLDSSSLIIGVMGLTGSGKSSLISLLTDERVEIGHELKACTSEVGVHCATWKGRTIYFVDTPGFDDSFRSDTDVLKDIAYWLSKAYSQEIRLAGMVYLHRITDDRMSGVAVKNMHMFEKLCGPNSLSNVILATTMWDHLEKQDPTLKRGIAREKELIEDPNFWKYMVTKGSRLERHDGTKESAWRIVSHILAKKTPVTLDIQVQLVDQEQLLDETPAGHFLQRELHDVREKHKQDLQDLTETANYAASIKDAELTERVEQERKEFEAKIARTYEEQHKLKTDMQAMMDEQARRHEEKLHVLKLERERQQDELRNQEQEFFRVQRNIREMQLTSERKDQEHKAALADMIELQRSQADKDETQRRQERERQEQIEHERHLDQMRLDVERTRQSELQHKMQEESMRLEKTQANISMVKVIGGVGLAALGSYTQMPGLSAAGMHMASRSM